MPNCRRCGEELEIRWISGRLVPLHIDGRCVPYSEEARQTSWWVVCRVCGKRCHLVHHNGGYVMLDELGPPWPKHPCFAEMFGTPAPKQSLTRLIGVTSGQNTRPGLPENSFWSDPLFLESALQWFFTTLEGVWILPLLKGHFLKVQSTKDGWTVITQFGPRRSTSRPFVTPQEAFLEAGHILTRSCKDLVSQMKLERRSSSQHPTPIQWDLFRAADTGYESKAFGKLSKTGAQDFLLKAFSRKYHATAGPPSLARNPYLWHSIDSGPLSAIKQMKASLQPQPIQAKPRLPSGGYPASVRESKCDFSGKHVLLFRNLQKRAYKCPICHRLVSFTHPQFEGFKEHVNACCIDAKKAGGKGCPICQRAGQPT